jgi:hypothetical protein
MSKYFRLLGREFEIGCDGDNHAHGRYVHKRV